MAEFRTAAISSSWTALEHIGGRQVELINNTDAVLLVRYEVDLTSGHHIEVPSKASVLLGVGTSSADLEVKGAGAGNYSIIVE